MTRQEYNMFRYIKKMLRVCPANYGCMCTIPVDGSRDYKARLNKLYEDNNMYPVDVKVNSRIFDEKLRIVYLYGANDTFTDCYGRVYTKKDALRTPEEKARIADALNS